MIKVEEHINDKKISFVVIAAKYQNKWILCRHKARNTWEIVGGHREVGETLEETARRELYEETGAIQAAFDPMCVYSVIGENQDERKWGMLYKADVNVMGKKPRSEIDEVIYLDELPKDIRMYTYPEMMSFFMREFQEK